jgi:hypothetical protein
VKIGILQYLYFETNRVCILLTSYELSVHLDMSLCKIDYTNKILCIIYKYNKIIYWKTAYENIIFISKIL